MREIKFRAWNKEMNKISKPFSMYGNVLNYTDSDGLGVIKSLDKSEIIMQYTGLKDKNGKEIYEGDILQFSNKLVWYNNLRYKGIDMNEVLINHIKYPHERREVRFELTEEWLSSPEISMYWEVIGNIYENPELLELK